MGMTGQAAAAARVIVPLWLLETLAAGAPHRLAVNHPARARVDLNNGAGLPCAAEHAGIQDSIMATDLLIAGHSHIECLHQAASAARGTSVEMLNLNVLRKQSPDESQPLVKLIKKSQGWSKPRASRLCLRGNQHNIIGIVENPRPYAIGDASEGAAPPGLGERWFIPEAVMLDEFRAKVAQMRSLAQQIYDLWPNAARYYLNAPPPMANWEHIKANPGVFRAKVRLGPAPDALKLKLYELQTQAYRELAESCGASFIEPAPETCTESGFLGDDYYNDDPTHGNPAYGAVMMRRILSTMETAQ